MHIKSKLIIDTNLELIQEWMNKNMSVTYIRKQLKIPHNAFKEAYPGYKGMSEKRVNLHANYNLNPTRCKQCNNIIDILLRKQTFCSHNCSAAFYNLKRGPMSVQQKAKISATAKANKPKRLITQKCINCNVEFASKWSSRKTCSNECFKIICNKNGSVGGRKASSKKRCSRSKNEKLLFELIHSTYNDAISNKRMFNGYDADIIIPSLKVAIHWNGPLHSLPLFGNELLNKIQKRDQLRYEAINKAGYTNYIINDANNKGFNRTKVINEYNKLITNLNRRIEKTCLVTLIR